MGQNTTIKSIGLALLTTSFLSTSAIAGGFDRGGVNIDQLFDTDRFAASAQLTYVLPQRTLENIVRTNNLAVAPAIQTGVGGQIGGLIGSADPAVIGAFIADPANEATVAAVTAGVTAAVTSNPAFANASAGSLDVDGDYVVPRFGAKFNVGQGADCLASYSEPFGADAEYGANNAYSATAVSFSIDSQDYGLTCSYQFGAGATSVGDAFARVIVGGSYQQLEGFQARQTFLDLANAGIGNAGGVGNTSGIGTFNVDGDAFGYRVGVAYEIPDIALRATLLYSSKYDYDLSGVQNNTGFDPLIAGTEIVPISLQTEIPQSLEARFQSGISEGTLAFANIKWQDWSKLDVIPIQGALSPVDGGTSNLAFEPGYRDGYTVTAGIAKVLTEELAARVSLTWDRGTATVSGTQTDSWTLAGGVRYTASESVDLNLGGAIGLLTSGTSTQLPNSIDQSGGVDYSFGNDIVYAISGGAKFKF